MASASSPTTYEIPTDSASRQLMVKRMVFFQIRVTFFLPGKPERGKVVYYLRVRRNDASVYSEGFVSDVGSDPLGLSEVSTLKGLWTYLREPTTSARGEVYTPSHYEIWPPGHIDLFDGDYRPPSEATLSMAKALPNFVLDEPPVLQPAGVETTRDGYAYFPGTRLIYGKMAGLSVENLSTADAVKLKASGEALYHVEVLKRPVHNPPGRDLFIQIKRDAGSLRKR